MGIADLKHSTQRAIVPKLDISASDTENSSFSALPKQIRLSKRTHELTMKAISGEWGREMKSLGFGLHEAMDTSNMSEPMKYAHSVRLISQQAPLRYEPGMKLIGSATVYEASLHMIPVYNNPSLSHTTIGFEQALQTGMAGIRTKLTNRLADGDLREDQREYLEAMKICLESYDVWHQRNLELAEQQGLTDIASAMRRVPELPPTSFFEAILALRLMWTWTRLCGNWSAIGRFDKMLGPLLEQDLASGKITLDEARELVAHFWLMGAEWTRNEPGDSGDAQFYQNIVLSGIDEQGRDITNTVTYLVLDVVEELRLADFPVALRLSKDSPEKLIRRMAEVQRLGGGIIACYNEPIVLEALDRLGFPEEDARNFANDGCWEVLIPGKTTFGYAPFDLLQLLQEVIGVVHTDQPAPQYDNFNQLYTAFEQRLAKHVDFHNQMCDTWETGQGLAIVPSLFVEGCIENAADYHNRGSKYNELACHAGGMADVANSLTAIKQAVFDSQLISWDEMVQVMRDDWMNAESLRRFIASRVPSYGNDDEQADDMMLKVFNSFTTLVGETKFRKGVFRPAGISTFGREIEWSPNRKATADGHHAGDILATNFSPSPGSEKHGPTAALNSYCKMDFTKLPGIGPFELKVLPASVVGEKGIDTMVSLIKAFLDMGGCFLHIDVVDSSVLIDAQRHPEKYPNLAVRISGWSARFATLNKQWQDMIINRTQQVL